MESRLKSWKYAKSDARFVLFRLGNVAIWFTIYYFQDTSVVGKKVKELKDRLYHLSVVIIETFTPDDENGSDEVIGAAKGIKRDIEDLLRYHAQILRTIIVC